MFRMSLRELLIGVALLAIAIVSLKYASDTGLVIVAAITMLVFFVALIVAVVDRGTRQAFAIGFALIMAAYGLVLMTGQRISGFSGNITSKNIEFDQWEGRLPTTRLLRYVHASIDKSQYVDAKTGKEIAHFSPPWAVTPQTRAGGTFGGKTFSFIEIPSRDVFMPIGHCWWALILGYAGSHFAKYVYWRRLRDEQKLPADTS